MKRFFLLLLATAVLSPLLLNAQDEAKTEPLKGIEGSKAPALGVQTWINLPEGKERLTLFDFPNKVVVIFLFQSTCEASKKREFPMLQQLVKEFQGIEDVVFLAIQTPFQDYTSNSEFMLKPMAEEFDLDIPFGHLAKTKGAYSINVAYETGGTPWWVVINKEGVVEFNGFTMNAEVGAENIRKLIAGEKVE